MGRKRTPGFRLRGETWYVDKVIFGQRVVKTTRTGELQEAERYLAHRTEEIRRAEGYGIRPKRLFKEATAKYLSENMHKRSIGDDASRLKGLLPFIVALFKVNTGTREQEVCQLRWEWEIQVPELNTSVFLIPRYIVKNKEDRLVVLNRLGHRNGDITSHYPAPEIEELPVAVKRVCEANPVKTPPLTLLKRKMA